MIEVMIVVAIVAMLIIDPASARMTITMKAAGGNGTLVFLPSPALVAGTPPTDRVQWTCTGGTLDQHAGSEVPPGGVPEPATAAATP